MKEKTDYKVHILVQGSKSIPESPSAELPGPSTSTAECPTSEETTTTEPNSDDKPDNVDKPIPDPTPTTPTIPSTPSSRPGNYACHACQFTTTRLNVLILHNKSHSVGFVPYTPTPTKKKPTPKPTKKSAPTSSKTPKQRKPRKEKIDQPKIINKKRPLEDSSVVESKKPKTDEEIKISLLADWDDDIEDESNDESATATARSPEVPLGAESPAVPTPAELPAAPVPELSLPDKKSNSSLSTEKPEASSDSNKYEFCEDEDWPVEADVGRKIPRVKNPIRTEESKSLSIDEDDMAREVAELLNRTAVPDLPAVPEPLKVEENFPEPSVVKSPDKKFDNSSGKAPDGAITEAPPTKAIFKTKTFFRSRHSRSQDAIGKYVAEQLNNVERMDIADSDLNGSDNVSSPETRDSSPIDQVKVARLAPKIELKRMKAEAQLREKERNRYEPSSDPYSLLADIMVSDEKPESPIIDEVRENIADVMSNSNSTRNVLYPTQEIKPVSEKEVPPKEKTVYVQGPITNYDAKTKREDTRDTTIDENHKVIEESESSQDTCAMEIDQEKENKKSSLDTQEELQNCGILYKKNIEKSIGVPGVEVPDQMLSETPEPIDFMEDEKAKPPEPYMNESTASAVDALLSVSRDADRVTRVISHDPPEDLFEDDKFEDDEDDSINGNINGELDKAEEATEESEQVLEYEQTILPANEQEVTTEKEIQIDKDHYSFTVNEEPLANHENAESNMTHESEEFSEDEEVPKNYEFPDSEDGSTINEPVINECSTNQGGKPYCDEKDDLDESTIIAPFTNEFSSNKEEKPYCDENIHTKDEDGSTKTTPIINEFTTNQEENENIHTMDEDKSTNTASFINEFTINQDDKPDSNENIHIMDEDESTNTAHFINEFTTNQEEKSDSSENIHTMDKDESTNTASFINEFTTNQEEKPDCGENILTKNENDSAVNSLSLNEFSLTREESPACNERHLTKGEDDSTKNASFIHEFSSNQEETPACDEIHLTKGEDDSTKNAPLIDEFSSSLEKTPACDESDLSKNGDDSMNNAPCINKFSTNQEEKPDCDENIRSNQEQSANSVFAESHQSPVYDETKDKNAFIVNDDVHNETVTIEYPQNELHIPEYVESEHVMMHSGFSEIEEEIVTTQESEIVSEENMYFQNEDEIPAVQDETEIPIESNPDDYIATSEVYDSEEVVTTPHMNNLHEISSENVDSSENVPSESDLQIAEALINLPATVHNKTPTEPIDNHIMTSSFEIDNIQEEVIPSSEMNIIEEEVTVTNAPKSTINLKQQPFVPDDESVNVRFETEQEKCENLNAAQSLLHMSESIEHTISMPEPMETEISEPLVKEIKQNNGIGNSNVSEIKKPLLTSSSKLLQMLEEPSRPKFASKISPSNHNIVMRGKERILNFDVAKSAFKSKNNSPKQKIIIRRTTPSKTILNHINELPGQEKIILSRNNQQEGSSVQRFTIQTSPDSASDANTIIIQQKIRKLTKSAAKLHKIKPLTSLVTPVSESKPVLETSIVDNAMFDINSMPIVLSEDLITAESIENMPVVMSDANVAPIITQPQQPQPLPKIVKSKVVVTENEKITVTSMPKKSELKSTLLVNSSGDLQNKAAAPNILSKSTKIRAAKPMLVIDKTTGKQKIIMKADHALKEVKPIHKTIIQKPTLIQKAPTLIQKVPSLIQKAPTLIQKGPTLIQKGPTLIQKTLVQKQSTLIQKPQTLIQSTPTLIQTTPTLLQTTQNFIHTAPTVLQSAPTLIQAGPHSSKKPSQGEKYIILPTQNAPRSGRTQKILIDPQTGKAHMILSKSNETPTMTVDNKPVSAKLVPSKSETPPGNTVMIITNAQGTQSRIVLTPEHEKILFPNKQQPTGSQLKTIAHRITTANALKTVLTPPAPKQVVASAQTPTRIVPKQKNAIITSKGQLIVGGRIATTAQNIAPMPEPRPPAKRVLQTEPKKLVQIQKTNSEPLIFLHQKSGAVMQLTASQFEQLQRSGQIVQKAPAQPVQERVIIQKARTAPEPSSSHKGRTKKNVQSPTPAKRSKHQHEVAIAPAPPAPTRLSPLLSALTPILPAAPAPAPAPAPPPPPPAAPASKTPPSTPVPTICIAPLPTAPSCSSYSDLDNFEEMLPSTAIARQLPEEPPAEAPEADPAAAIGDGQLLAVTGEHFGGPPGSFYLCVIEQGAYLPIDNRPLVLENNQLVPMAEVAAPPPPPPPERRDILSAALANSEVFHAEEPAPDFRDLNANVSVHCRVSETSSTLHQPIMTPLEVPSSAADRAPPPEPTSLEAGLAVIGVTPPAVPTTLELPITVTDPRIAPRTSDPLHYPTTLLPSPRADMCYVSAEEAPSARAISMPLLTEDEDTTGGGKSMPILTDELGSVTMSSVESALGSPGSESPPGPWARRLLTPGSDGSNLSAEIPLQPALQLSMTDLSDHT